MTHPTARRVLPPSGREASETAVVTTPTTESAASTVNATDTVPTECRLCGEPLLVRRPGRDTCARHPEVHDDMIGLPPA